MIHWIDLKLNARKKGWKYWNHKDNVVFLNITLLSLSPSLLLPFFVNWWCIDFNLYPLLPINYTKAAAAAVASIQYCHAMCVYVCLCVYVCISGYQQYGIQISIPKNLSLRCLFIMHFNYVKTSFEPQFLAIHGITLL